MYRALLKSSRYLLKQFSLPIKPDNSTMRETRVINSGLSKECQTLGHPYVAGFSTKHYLPDKLEWSAFVF